MRWFSLLALAQVFTEVTKVTCLHALLAGNQNSLNLCDSIQVAKGVGFPSLVEDYSIEINRLKRRFLVINRETLRCAVCG